MTATPTEHHPLPTFQITIDSGVPESITLKVTPNISEIIQFMALPMDDPLVSYINTTYGSDDADHSMLYDWKEPGYRIDGHDHIQLVKANGMNAIIESVIYWIEEAELAGVELPTKDINAALRYIADSIITFIDQIS